MVIFAAAVVARARVLAELIVNVPVDVDQTEEAPPVRVRAAPVEMALIAPAALLSPIVPTPAVVIVKFEPEAGVAVIFPAAVVARARVLAELIVRAPVDVDQTDAAPAVRVRAVPETI